MTKKEAIELAAKFGVNYLEHPNLIVTENGNVYTDGNVDPKDMSIKFFLNDVEAAEEVTDEVPKKKKK
jgi:ATP-dependent helicase YprA (DUF1998 family)